MNINAFASTMLSFLRGDRGRRLMRWLTYSALAFFVFWSASLYIQPRYAIGINESSSLPGFLYLIIKNEAPARGEMIVFRAPDTVKYYPAGYLFTKIAAGVPGDLVEYRGRDVYINGKFYGHAKTHSQMGHPLALGPSGTIPPGHYFAWTPSKDSYDSRYADIGWVSPDRLVGKAVRLL